MMLEGGMGRRQFMRLIGAAAAWSRAERAPTLPDGAAGDTVRKEEDFPLIVANMPATGRQKAIAVGAAVLLLSSRRRLSHRSRASSWVGLMPSFQFCRQP